MPQHYLYTQYICTYMTANAHIYNITTYCRPGDTPFDIEPTPIQKGCFCAAHIHHITLYVCIHTNISDHLLETKKKQKKSPHTAILETQHPAKPIKKSRFVHHWPSSTLVECKHLIHILKCQLHTATHCNTLQHTATHCNTLQHPTGRPAPSANPNMSSQLHTADTNSQRSAIWSFPLSN